VSTASKAIASAVQAAACGYGVLLLPPLLSGDVAKEEIVLPLTLAYVFSGHLEFRLPLASRALAAVENAFDEIIRSVPLVSKGVMYVRMQQPGPAELHELLRASTLVVRTDQDSAAQAPADAAEIVILAAANAAEAYSGSGKVPRLVSRNLDRVRDPELRKKIADCVAVFDLGAGGHITQGDFSVSW
jgi:hypothetical protein